MRRRILTVALLVLAGGLLAGGAWVWAEARAVQDQTAVARLAALGVDHRILPVQMEALGPLGEDFGVTSRGEVYLAGKDLTAVSAGGEVEALAEPVRTESLAVGADDAVLLTGLGRLRAAGGEPGPGLRLSGDATRLAPSATAGQVYVIAQHQGEGSLVRLSEDGSGVELLRSAAPLVAAADTLGGTVYAATERQVLRLDGGSVELVFEAPPSPFPPITSIAVADDDQLFVATEKRVYLVAGREALSIVNDSGGSLRWRGGSLYVLDRNRKLLYALSPADGSLLPRD